VSLHWREISGCENSAAVASWAAVRRISSVHTIRIDGCSNITFFSDVGSATSTEHVLVLSAGKTSYYAGNLTVCSIVYELLAIPCLSEQLHSPYLTGIAVLIISCLILILPSHFLSGIAELPFFVVLVFQCDGLCH